MDSPVTFETFDHIAHITLNRPHLFNAFDEEVIRSLADRLSAVSRNSQIKGVILTGAGKAFCAGGDLMALTEGGRPFEETFYSLAAIYHQATLEIRHMPKPVVAAVNGFAAGGGFSLALSCDFRIMASSAIMRQAYTTNGLSIDGGGTYSLPRIVGIAKAMEIVAFDHPITAEMALDMGLVTEVCEDDHVLEKAISMVKRIAAGALSSFAASKKLIYASLHTSLEAQLEQEREYLALCAAHPNGKEGIAAFKEKRRPHYG
jgi:2-(1,2-epoxy-1,2-dihydrophenyl)acetyl-CoA isomerase